MLQFNKHSSVASWISHVRFNVLNDCANAHNLFFASIYDMQKICAIKMIIFSDRKMMIIYENLQFSGAYL